MKDYFPLKKINPSNLLFLLFLIIWVIKDLLFAHATGIGGVFICKFLWPIFFGGFIFLTKRHTWSIILQFFYDAILVSCLIYYNANTILPDIGIAIDSIAQLATFGASIITYVVWECYVFPLLTILYIVVYKIIKKRAKVTKKNPKAMVWCTILFVIGTVHYIGYKRWVKEYYEIPVRIIIDEYVATGQAYGDRYGWKGWKLLIPGGQAGQSIPAIYIHYTDLMGYEIACTYDYIFNFFYEYKIDVTDEVMKPFLNTSSNSPKAKEDLVIILVESMEEWVLDYKDMNGNYAMPNLRKWIQDGPSFVARKITPEARHGVSGDGQMTVLTGLLPTQKETVSIRYAYNTFPALTHCYDSTLIIAPCFAWNQDVMNERYNIKKRFWGEDSDVWHDDKIIDVTDSLWNDTPLEGRDPQFMLVLTYDTHTPFPFAHMGTLKLSNDISEHRQKYLQCMNVLDKHLERFFDYYNRSSSLQDATVVITGDHTIFRSDTTYCPLIIRSPHITKSERREDVCHQMDIYPTIINLVGLQDSYWKGFGINLLDKSATRCISEEEAYKLSDVLIRSNYFKKE